MVTLTINNSYSQVTGLTPAQEKELRNLLSYTANPQAAYFSGGFPQKRYLIDKKGNFPTGLLSLVKPFLRSHNVTVKDLRKLPKYPSTSIKQIAPFPMPYLDQEKAVKAAINLHQGVLSMPTGTGKSITICLLIHALQAKTLIVVPNLSLKTQLTQTIQDYFGNTKNIVVENIDSPRLKDLTDFDCIIIDEAHHSCAATYRKLNKTAWAGIFYRFYFTATPFRSKDEEQLLLQSITGDVIYELTYKDAVAKGYIVPVECYYYELPKSPVEGYTWAQIYNELVVNNQARNFLIADIMDKLFMQDLATLVLVKEIKHGDKLSILTGMPFASGEGKNASDLLAKFNSKALSCLIGTTGVLGEGCDTKPAEFVVIAGLGKSKNQFIQMVGRGVRRFEGKQSCKILIFKDKSHKWTISHFNAQVKHLRDEYGVEPIKLTLDPKPKS